MPGTTTTKTIVGYPGRDGAHSAAACDRLFPDAELVPLPSFAAVTTATAEGEIDAGVLPIESSLAGPVAETHDLLYDSPLRSPARPCSRSGTASSGPQRSRARRSARCTPTRWRSTSAADCSRRCRGRRRSQRRPPPTQPHTSPSVVRRPRSRSRASAPRNCTGSRSSRQTSETTLRPSRGSSRSRRTCESTSTASPGGPPSRSSPTISRALSTGRSSRSPATGSTSCSSCPARSRSHPGATGSTPSSRDIHSMPSCARRSSSSASERGGSASSAPTRGRTAMSESAFDPVVQRLREEISELDASILDAVNARLELVAALRRHKDAGRPPLRRSGSRTPAARRSRAREPRPALRRGPS